MSRECVASRRRHGEGRELGMLRMCAVAQMLTVRHSLLCWVSCSLCGRASVLPWHGFEYNHILVSAERNVWPPLCHGVVSIL